MVRIVFHVNQYTHRHTISRVSLAPPTQPHTRDEMTSSTYEMLQLPISTTASVGQLIGLVTLVHLNQQECYNYSFFLPKTTTTGEGILNIIMNKLTQNDIGTATRAVHGVHTIIFPHLSLSSVCVCRVVILILQSVSKEMNDTYVPHCANMTT